MTDREFDGMLRAALMEANRREFAQVLAGADSLEIHWAPRYRRRRARLLADPFGYGKRRSASPWRKALRAAACAVLAVAVGLGGLLTLSPEARARARELWAQWTPYGTEYRFEGGEAQFDPEAVWRPGYLPEGFNETDVVGGDGIWRITFTGAGGETIFLDYQPMVEGMGFNVDNEHSEFIQISIHGMAAELYRSTAPTWPSMLIWTDPRHETAFLLMGEIPYGELVQVAESIAIMK